LYGRVRHEKDHPPRRRITGHIGSFDGDGDQEVTYLLGGEYWGGGIATQALLAFLRVEEGRPLYTRAAKDYAGSIRVLQKCGFGISGEDKAFAYARGREVEELVLVLPPGGAP
jgi:RimJ/RimL family protein N-acetyltransferase